MPVSHNTGIVIARYNKNILIETEQGEILPAVARKKLSHIVCGDKISWESSGVNEAVITGMQERTTLLSRPDRRGQLRPIAANIDQMIIVNAINVDDETKKAHRFNIDLIDHYLVAAETLGISPTIVANKADRCDEQSLSTVHQQLKHYQEIGYPVLTTSSKTGTGLQSLEKQLENKTSILVGESGVGKSSLIKNLLPDQEIRIGKLSAISGQGMHTTTTTTLYHLTGTGNLIDSPGVREFSLWNISQQELADGFREFLEFFGQCKFRNCRHTGEQGCSLDAAVDEGLILEQRLSSYRRILTSLKSN